MKFRNVLIIGATSAIAQEAAREFARNKCSLILAARSQDKLDTLRNDIMVHGATMAHTMLFDAEQFNEHLDIVSRAATQFGTIDAVLIAYGSLPDNQQCVADAAQTIREFTLNATSIIAISTGAAQYFESIGRGTLAVITSVAGDRGRQSNYVYGASKGALNTFLQGLRNRLAHKNIHVVTIKPGFVDTPMTSHLPKNPLFASAKAVGKSVAHAMAAGKDVVYIPFFWRYIMLIIKSIPEFMFKRLKL